MRLRCNDMRHFVGVYLRAVQGGSMREKPKFIGLVSGFARWSGEGGKMLDGLRESVLGVECVISLQGIRGGLTVDLVPRSGERSYDRASTVLCRCPSSMGLTVHGHGWEYLRRRNGYGGPGTWRGHTAASLPTCRL